MTIAVDMGRKATKTKTKNSNMLKYELNASGYVSIIDVHLSVYICVCVCGVLSLFARLCQFAYRFVRAHIQRHRTYIYVRHTE